MPKDLTGSKNGRTLARRRGRSLFGFLLVLVVLAIAGAYVAFSAYRTSPGPLASRYLNAWKQGDVAEMAALSMTGTLPQTSEGQSGGSPAEFARAIRLQDFSTADTSIAEDSAHVMVTARLDGKQAAAKMGSLGAGAPDASSEKNLAKALSKPVVFELTMERSSVGWRVDSEETLRNFTSTILKDPDVQSAMAGLVTSRIRSSVEQLGSAVGAAMGKALSAGMQEFTKQLSHAAH